MTTSNPSSDHGVAVIGPRCRSGLFFPLLLIVIGGVLLLDQYGVIAADRVFAYFWAGLFIVFGLEMVLARRGRLGVGVVALGIGVALVFHNLGYWAFDAAKLWPLLLVAFGLALLVRGPSARRDWPRRRSRLWTGAPLGFASGPADSQLAGVAILGGIQRRITAQDFRGGNLTAFFGGFQIDLTHAEIAGETAVLDLSALFGGGEVRVPETWIIDIQGQALLGAYNDETHQAVPQAGAKRLVIQGLAILGGVVIKN